MLRACRRCLTSKMPLKRQPGLNLSNSASRLTSCYACRLNDIIGGSSRDLQKDIEMLGYLIPAKVLIKLFISKLVYYSCLTDKFSLFIHYSERFVQRAGKILSWSLEQRWWVQTTSIQCSTFWVWIKKLLWYCYNLIRIHSNTFILYIQAVVFLSLRWNYF